MNKLNTFKNQKSLIDSKSNSNIGNADEINTHRLASSTHINTQLLQSQIV
jgi:hypothetical protein